MATSRRRGHFHEVTSGYSWRLPQRVAPFVKLDVVPVGEVVADRLCRIPAEGLTFLVCAESKCRPTEAGWVSAERAVRRLGHSRGIIAMFSCHWWWAFQFMKAEVKPAVRLAIDQRPSSVSYQRTPG